MGTEVGPLTSSSPGRGQSLGGALWTPVYTPGDVQTSWVYSTNPVLHLYISCYVTVNKPVLSYLSLCLLLQTLGISLRMWPWALYFSYGKPSSCIEYISVPDCTVLLVGEKVKGGN
jgi:hypothetical protein